jgi:uncharacterized membrane protein
LPELFKILMVNKNTIHIALIAVLVAGTLFAWYNSAKDLGIIPSDSATCGATAATMLGLPICVWGAIFFTIALSLAAAMWYIKE